jgi:8-oxo-dGTP pyrophosphatase MutT (NUDIX family)
MDIIEQAAALPYRFQNGAVELLVVQTRSGNKWTIPKGIIDPGYTAHQTAVEESYEEAGIKGRLREKQYARFNYRKWESTCEVAVFLLQVEELFDSWPEKAWRRRKWISRKDDLNLFKYQNLEKIVREFLSDETLHQMLSG